MARSDSVIERPSGVSGYGHEPVTSMEANP